MHDMLVRLYDLDFYNSIPGELYKQNIEIRKPIGSERYTVIDWVRKNFSVGWAGEVSVATGKHPFCCFIAVKNSNILGFACYDSTALGFFGPTGVLDTCRGKGLGKALLMACMQDMRLKGYGYAVVGGVGPEEFYRKAVGAINIPESSPGIYKSLLKRDNN